jgi:serine protease DegQ
VLPLRNLWLIFAQTVTVLLAALFIVATLKPDWLKRGGLLGSVPSAISDPIAAVAPKVTVQEVPRPVPVTDAARIPAPGFAQAAKIAAPAVVNIFTTKQIKTQDARAQDPFFRHFFGDGAPREENVSSLGSGVIVSKEGYVLTNNHVVESADEIEVALNDGRKSLATVVGTDPETDLAVVKVALKNLPAITFSRPEEMQVGDAVLAIGNPFGVGQTVTAGIISALGRSHLNINTFENFIQTDAAINPGNSGGALVNSSGALLGINTAIYSRDGGSLGIGFAIPVSTARQVMEQIITTGQVVRGYIGVDPQDLSPELSAALRLKTTEGVIIRGVVRNGPADKAGVKAGDVLTEINGKVVRDNVEVLNTVAALNPGVNTTLKVFRNNEARDVNVVVGKRPPALPRRPETQQ